MPPAFSGVHHLKFPVSDLDTSIEWFTRALCASRIERFDHRGSDGELFAVMLDLPGIAFPVELRHAPDAAAAVAGYDPVTLGVHDEHALDQWLAHFDTEGVTHTGKVTGFIGTLVAVTSPDGLPIRLYTDPPGGFDNVTMRPEQADIDNTELTPPLMRSRPSDD